MRTKTKKAKKVLDWFDFKAGLERAGFESKPEHPEWMLLNTKGDQMILAIPGDESQKPLPGESVYEKDIHVVWFATRVKTERGYDYTTSMSFPIFILT
ncbi:MAG: hypothetical protein P8J32_07490 [bacterium]|nr:hypothetical protein [bacterium]